MSMTTSHVVSPCEEENPPEGIYGPMHWLDDCGITHLMAPYVEEGWGPGNYRRFSGLNGEDAGTLLRILPMPALDDRQNNAPCVGALLRAAQRLEGVELGGYMIRAPRWDERISIDTVWISHDAVRAYLPDYESHTSLGYGEWEALRTLLRLHDDAIIPDEFQVLIRDVFGMRGWWAWWD